MPRWLYTVKGTGKSVIEAFGHAQSELHLRRMIEALGLECVSVARADDALDDVATDASDSDSETQIRIAALQARIASVESSERRCLEESRSYRERWLEVAEALDQRTREYDAYRAVTRKKLAFYRNLVNAAVRARADMQRLMDALAEFDKIK